jgi:DNA invertase Pin-like site-specific DNA recombinase
MEPGKATSRRCAIYTRKSSEEGLEQDFNSLHAQREACESYIKPTSKVSRARAGAWSRPRMMTAACQALR